MRISISWNEVRHATISSSAVAALRRSSATGGERIATRRACFKKDKEVHELPPGAGAVEWLSPGSPHYSLLKQGSCWSGALLVANLVVQPPPLAKCHTLWSEVNPPVAVWDSLMCSASVGGRIGTHPASRNSHTHTPLACILAPTSRTHPSILLGIWGLWRMRPSRGGDEDDSGQRAVTAGREGCRKPCVGVVGTGSLPRGYARASNELLP